MPDLAMPVFNREPITSLLGVMHFPNDFKKAGVLAAWKLADYTMSVPTGATIVTAAVYTTTAYTAGTDAKIQIGSSAGDASYVAATSIASIGVHKLTLANAAAAPLLSMPAGTPNLFVRIVQSGSPTAVGAAMLVIDYTQA